MKWDNFEFRQVTNFRTMAIIALRDNPSLTVEALTAMLDRYITEKDMQLKRDGRLPPAQITSDHRAANKQERKEIAQKQRQYKSARANSVKEMKEKLVASTQCPECASGRVVEEIREDVKVRFCTYPEQFRGGFIKFESGCGYSRMVD